MKKLLLILCLILAFNSYTQTTTKKYNSLQKRYEYYQNGKMIGYEKYNSLKDQWEYYSTKTTQSTSSYGEPVSNFDAELAMKVLQAKQNKFDSWKKRIENYIINLGKINAEYIDYIKDEKVKKEYSRLWNKYAFKFVENNMHLVKDESKHYKFTKMYMNYLNSLYEQALKNTVEEEVINIPKFKNGEYVSITDYAPLKEKPYSDSKTIEYLEAPVKVLSIYSNGYYKVKTDSNIGYVKKQWLIEKVD